MDGQPMMGEGGGGGGGGLLINGGFWPLCKLCLNWYFLELHDSKICRENDGN